MYVEKVARMFGAKGICEKTASHKGTCAAEIIWAYLLPIKMCMLCICSFLLKTPNGKEVEGILKNYRQIDAYRFLRDSS